MKRLTTRSNAVCLAVGSLILAGCSEGEQPEGEVPTSAAPRTSETVATAAPTVDEAVHSSTAPTMSAREQDEEAIAVTLVEYEAARMAAMRGEESIEGIYPFSSGTAREQWTTQVMSYEAQGLTISGQTALEVIEMSISDGSAEVVACLDVSDFEAVDTAGESIVPDDRLDRTLVDFVLERAATAEHGWLVTEDVNRDEPCDG